MAVLLSLVLVVGLMPPFEVFADEIEGFVAVEEDEGLSESADDESAAQDVEDAESEVGDADSEDAVEGGVAAEAAVEEVTAETDTVEDAVEVEVLAADSDDADADADAADADADAADAEETDPNAVSLVYGAYVLTYGWSYGVTADATETTTIGAAGLGVRLEALQLSVASSLGGSIRYRVSAQGYGWLDWASDGETAGAAALTKLTEAVQIRLTGELAEAYDVWYRVYVEDYGWLDWACNGETAGTVDLYKRLEAVQVVLVAKGGAAPGDTDAPCVEVASVSAAVYQQSSGWLTAVSDGATAGTAGGSLRLEALRLTLSAYEDGSIAYSVYVDDAWQGWVSDGEAAGTAGSSLSIEAVKIELTGDAAEAYDVWYRVYVQGFGWLDWACNGEAAGTVGYGYRVEAIQVVVQVKNTAAPGDTDTPFVTTASVATTVYQQSNGWLSAVSDGEVAGTAGGSLRLESLKLVLSAYEDGSITYNVYVEDDGWQGWVSDGETAGTAGSSLNLEAIKIKLTGDVADVYDVWYRVYVEDYGWLDWACNGDAAGVSGLDNCIVAIQVTILEKDSDAPGDTTTPYYTSISGDLTLDGYLYEIYAKYGTNLKTLFNYVSSYTYIRTYDTPSGSWKTWSVEYAKQMYENQGGNCYRYAALFCWLARGLGYNAKTVTGYVPSRSSGWAAHGWVEIVINGTTYVYDPDLAKDYPSYNWYKMTYSTAPLTYKKS